MLLPAGGPRDLSLVDEPNAPPAILQLDIPLLQGLLNGAGERVKGQVHIAVIFG